MARYNFFEVFREVEGGLTPTRPIRIGGVTISPGVVFGRGVSFSGVDLFQHYGRDIEADYENGILVIRGYYP